MFLMGIIGFVIRILSFIAMYVISNPPIVKLESPDDDQKVYEINLGVTPD